MMAPAVQPSLDTSLSPESSNDNNNIPETSALNDVSAGYLVAKTDVMPRKTLRTIDPNLVCAMNNLAIPLFLADILMNIPWMVPTLTARPI
ncbi:hypothetical protein G6F68_020968 [Rhizopus microsporus]|nr:hypothetical protein G6F68_020968 [Rhizopus microsporus]